MSSPYQLILLNLIHIQAFLLGVVQMIVLVRPGSRWRPAMSAWKSEQERQLRILLVMFRQVGGFYGPLHLTMLTVAKSVGRIAGTILAILPLRFMRFMIKQVDETLITGLERAGHQISLADWAEWDAGPAINPPKALFELSVSRREWPAKWEGLVQFL